jgi:hypothetical protein
MSSQIIQHQFAGGAHIEIHVAKQIITTEMAARHWQFLSCTTPAIHAIAFWPPNSGPTNTT